MSNRRSRANGEGSIFPYRNGFAAYAWVTTPAGTRKRKYVYGKTREEVHTKWIALTQKASQGVVATGVPKLETFLTGWLRDVIKPNAAPLTYSTYETFVRLYLIPGLGGKRVDRLQVRDVQRWLNALRLACQCCAQGKDAARPTARRKCCAVKRCCMQVLSPRSVADARGILRSALSHAMTEDLISKNVATLAKVPAGRTHRKQAWTSEEAKTFLESARAAKDPFCVAYVLILILALRKGEVLGLQWPYIDFEQHAVTIEWQLQRVQKQLLHRETKTEASDATLPLPDVCAAALRLRAAQQDADREAAGDAWMGQGPGEGFVLTGRYGTPVEPRTFNRAFTARCRAAGVPVITVHDARRTCATLLVDLDVHPRVIMQILRHAQIAVTMEIYSKASSKATREALKRLGEQLDS